MSLSKENSDKLLATGLYKKDPPRRDPEHRGEDFTYWCKNWTFQIKEGRNDQWWAIDTYYDSWDSHAIEVTDANFHEFEFVVDLTTIKSTSRDSAMLYREEDRMNLAIDSGGRTYSKWYIRNDAKPSRALKRIELVNAVESTKRSAEWAVSDLERFDKDENGYYATEYGE